MSHRARRRLGLALLASVLLVASSTASHSVGPSDQRCDEEPSTGGFFTEAAGTTVTQSFTPARGVVSGFEIAVANIERTTWRGTITADLVWQTPSAGASAVITQLAAAKPRRVAVASARRTWVRFDLPSPVSLPAALGSPAIRVDVPAVSSRSPYPPWFWLRCAGSYSRGVASVQAKVFLGPSGTAGTPAAVELPNDTQFRTY